WPISGMLLTLTLCKPTLTTTTLTNPKCAASGEPHIVATNGQRIRDRRALVTRARCVAGLLTAVLGRWDCHLVPLIHSSIPSTWCGSSQRPISGAASGSTAIPSTRWDCGIPDSYLTYSFPIYIAVI